MNASSHNNFVLGDPDASMISSWPLVQYLKFAKMLGDPLQFVHPDHITLDAAGLNADQIEGFYQCAEIRKHLNIAVMECLGLPTLDLPSEAFGPDGPSKKIAAICALITAHNETLDAFMRQVTAVRLQKAIRNCVLKADRERVQTILGDDAYNTALREAPYFYADLGEGTASNDFVEGLGLQHGAASFGASLIHDYIASIDKGLALIFSLRLPKTFLTTDASLGPEQLQALERLLAIKGPHLHVGVI